MMNIRFVLLLRCFDDRQVDSAGQRVEVVDRRQQSGRRREINLMTQLITIFIRFLVVIAVRISL